MVFDATMSILNEPLWVPNFIILVVWIILITVVTDTHMVYLDMGEIF